MSLASNNPEERKALHTFFEEFLTFKASRLVIKLADEKTDSMVLHILLQRQDESAYQSWSLSLQSEENLKKNSACNGVKQR